MFYDNAPIKVESNATQISPAEHLLQQKSSFFSRPLEKHLRHTQLSHISQISHNSDFFSL